MKKIVFIIAVVLTPLILGSWYSVTRGSMGKETVSYTLQNKTYNLLVADSPEEWSTGLMHVTKKDGFDGMLFIFPDYSLRTFWNKNTLVDLDVYWIKDDTVVGKSDLPSITKTKSVVTVGSPSEVNKVVEIIK